MTGRGEPVNRPVVAAVTDAIYPYNRGGKEIRYHEVLKRLSRDADVHVFTMQWWRGSRTLVADGVTYHAVCRKLPLYAHGRRSLMEAAVFALACTRLLRFSFDALEADHIPYAHLFVLKAVCRVKRRRFVVTWHEVWGRDAWVAYLGAKGRLAAWVERTVMRLPDEIVAASPQTADRVSAMVRGSVPVRVAPNGLDLAAIAAAEPVPDRTDLVFVGRLLSHKGADLVLRAMAILARDGRPVTCRIVGQGPELDPLRRLARELGLADLVEFRPDVVESSEVFSIVKAARVFVLPSQREGFGIAVLEAMACGLPVVTTDHPDNQARHLVGRAGAGLACPATPEAFAAAIDAMLTSTSAREPAERPGADAAAVLGSYDWDQVSCAVAEALRLRRL